MKTPVAKPAAIKPRKAAVRTAPVAIPFVDKEAAPAPVVDAAMTASVAAVIDEPVITPPAPAPAAEPTPQPAPAASAVATPKEVKMTDTINQTEETVKTQAAAFGEKANEMFKDVQGRAKEAFEKSGETMKDVVEFNKANLEAMVEAGKIAAKGAQTAAQNAVEFSRKNWEATTTHAKAVAAVKSPTEAFKIQGEFMRSQFDAAVAEFSRSTEFNLKLAGEIVQPLQNRFAAGSEMLKARMAA